MRFFTTTAAAAALAAMSFALPSAAHADVVGCQRTIAKEMAKFLGKKSKTLHGCEQKKLKGRLPLSAICATEEATKITKAEEGMKDKIVGGCAGETPATVGLPATCPDLEGLGCNGAITDISSAADCLVCLGEGAVDQLTLLTHGVLVDSSADEALNKCQQTISKETQKFLAKKSKEISKCWDKRLKGDHAGTCPDDQADPRSAPGKAAANIAKAQGKMKAAICKECGGEDEVCGGLDGMNMPTDFLPDEIGFATECAGVQVPGGSQCGVSVTTLETLADCLTCVTDFEADCTTSASVPQFVSYPGSCNSEPPPPPCTSAQIEVTTSFTPGAENIQGVAVSITYPGAKLAHVPPPANLSGVSGLFSFGDVDSPPIDGFNDLVNIGLAAVLPDDDIPPGPFATVSYDCRDGEAGPLASELGCTAVVSDRNGQPVAGTCAVALTVTP